MGEIARTRGRAAMACTSSIERPFLFRHSSSVTCSPGAKGRRRRTEEPRLSIWRAMLALRPATMALMPVTVMMPITTPRMVSPARSL